MNQLEDTYFTRFRDFLKSTQTEDSDLKKWQKAHIFWGKITCTNFWHLLDAAVTEGTAELRRILPASLGKASNGHPMPVNGVNLLLCLLHGTEVSFDRETVMNKAEKFTKTKHPLWDRSVIACLLALLRRDPEGFSQSLEDVRRSFGRVDCTKYMRLQCLNGYGLAVLAHDLLPAEDFQRVSLPEGPSFSPARIHQPYAGSENPHLSAKNRREWHLDGEGMLKELLAELCEKTDHL